MAIIIVLVSTAVAAFGWQLAKLHSNYVVAKKIGIPLLLSPFGVLHPIWQSGRWLPRLLKRLPLGLGDFVNYDPLSSYLPDRYHRHAQLGDAYAVVSPSTIVVMIANATAADDMLSRRKDFIKHPSMYDPLNIFGPNVDTLNGEDWQRHRRLTAPPFNEKNSSLVWAESLKQARAMLHSWLKIGPSGVRRMDNDTATLALHVLTAAGFGQSYSFEGGLTKPGPDHELTYRDALRLILHHMFVSIILGMVAIPETFLFGNFWKVKKAIKEFGRYMAEMVENERREAELSKKSKDNLMSVLVRSADTERVEGGRLRMTDAEIYGNCFIFNVAGHDTSAGVLHHAIIFLAAFPRVQDWIHEELKALDVSNGTEDWAYTEIFPRLRRCLAAMYETVRLIGAVPMLPKHTNKSPQTLEFDGRKIVVPPETFVFIQLSAIHSKPEYWGSDSLEWKPARWIVKDSKNEERLLEPREGTFLGWAGGPRVCPGKKFAQVEFVAAIATLLQKHVVKPVLQNGESFEAASRRLFERVQDCNIGASFRVNDPESLPLKWEERL